MVGRSLRMWSHTKKQHLLIVIPTVAFIFTFVLYQNTQSQRRKPAASSTSIGSSNGKQDPASAKYHIEPILHYVYKDKEAPLQYKSLIDRCMRMNPQLKVMLWTDQAALSFLKANYPNFLPTYTAYKDRLERSDSIRYFLLYHYGGIYMDMDVECRQNLLKGIRRLKTDCILDQERWEQTRIFWDLKFFVMNSVMACRKRHPFFKYVTEKLPSTSKIGHVVRSTGPGMLTNRFIEYSKKNDTPKVLAAHPETFSPKIAHADKLKKLCGKPPFKGKSWWAVGCRQFQKGNYSQNYKKYINERTLAVHLFLHLGYDFARHNIKSTFNLTEEFPSIKVYPDL